MAFGRAVYAIRWAAEVINRAGSLDTDAVIKAWEGPSSRRPGATSRCVRATTRCIVAEIMEPERIPAEMRYWDAFPYIGPPTMIPREEMTVPPRETGNPRCA